jgi:formylglycine-generating enzyme required for sulfatase activity
MKKASVLAVVVCVMAVMNVASADIIRGIDIDFVTIGNAVNTADTTGYGAVGYNYRIGKYEVTAGQYTEFLNAVAATDTYSLYNTNMWSDSTGCKIQQSGSSGSYSYAVAADRANRPVNWISWYDTLRFCNWLHNSQPSGPQNNSTTEDGAYTFTGPTSVGSRNPDAKVFLPTENEWYKAAYHKNDGVTGNYFDYPTSSDTLPGRDMTEATNPGNNANYWDNSDLIGSPYYRTEVGEFELSDSPYGTFDMGGNIFEWNETLIGSDRGIRGGSAHDIGDLLGSSYRSSGGPPNGEYAAEGFRVASVAEPVGPVCSGFIAGNNMNYTRTQHTATKLNDGTVLITGGCSPTHVNALNSAEIYNPQDGTFSLVGNMTVRRSFHTATLLSDGRVLICGGWEGSNQVDTAEIYNPVSKTFQLVGQCMHSVRESHRAVRLKDGRVFISGGVCGYTDVTGSCDLFDPNDNSFTEVGPLHYPRGAHVSVLLDNGNVLIAGGAAEGIFREIGEIYQPGLGLRETGVMNFPRVWMQGDVLPDRRVLLSGGNGPNPNDPFNIVEIYDPQTEVFTLTENLLEPRSAHRSAALPGGKILITGGDQDGFGHNNKLTEIYDPVTGHFSWSDPMTSPRSGHTVTLLDDGCALVTGGRTVINNAEVFLSSTEISCAFSMPVFTVIPQDINVECDGNETELNVWLYSAAANDICGSVTLSNDFSGLSDDCGETGSATVTWTAVNERGNQNSCSATFTIVDTTPPVITCPADVTLECPADTSPSATGQATGSDACGSVIITYSDVSVPGCGNTETITRTWTAMDECGNSTSCVQTITVVDTTAPVISNLNADYLLAAVGQTVNFTADVSDECDSGVDVEWNFGDGTAPSANPGHIYGQPGIYTAVVTATDDCGNVATDSIIIVVYDPSAGFTTGGGWFVPDSHSFVDGVGVTDTVSKANFGFIVKYKQGADNPDGNLEFQYKAGDINLRSTNMEWLVVQSATKVRFKGRATINGEGLYTFKVTAEDNGVPGTGDWFKIEIWLGPDVDTENTPPTPKHKAQGYLGGGNIQIHQK